MDHWLVQRAMEGKSFDHMYGFPADPPARPAKSPRGRRRLRAPWAWRRGVARPAPGAAA
jgi:hypothetical protein